MLLLSLCIYLLCFMTKLITPLFVGLFLSPSLPATQFPFTWHVFSYCLLVYIYLLAYFQTLFFTHPCKQSHFKPPLAKVMYLSLSTMAFLSVNSFILYVLPCSQSQALKAMFLAIQQTDNPLRGSQSLILISVVSTDLFYTQTWVNNDPLMSISGHPIRASHGGIRSRDSL